MCCVHAETTVDYSAVVPAPSAACEPRETGSMGQGDQTGGAGDWGLGCGIGQGRCSKEGTHGGASAGVP
jgi:hypothetical protein